MLNIFGAPFSHISDRIDADTSMPVEILPPLAFYGAAVACLLCIGCLVQVSTNKRYAGASGYTISEVAEQVKKDFGNIDILVSRVLRSIPP